jgi:tRNA(adenine34) deaminase
MGSCGSVIDLFRERYGHSPAVWSGVLGGECSELLRAFFGKLRR